jgi:glutathione S-transferase
MPEPIKLHRCSYTFLHTEMDSCWKVEKALKEQDIPYEVVKHGYGKSDKSRAEVIELSGQKLLPVLELPDGEVYREESSAMAERVRSGGLTSGPAGTADPA